MRKIQLVVWVHSKRLPTKQYRIDTAKQIAKAIAAMNQEGHTNLPVMSLNTENNSIGNTPMLLCATVVTVVEKKNGVCLEKQVLPGIYTHPNA